MLQLGLLEVGLDPHLAQWHQAGHLHTGLDVEPFPQAALADDAVSRGSQLGVAEFQPGLFELGFAQCQPGLVLLGFGIQHQQPLAGGLQGGFGLQCLGLVDLQAGAHLVQAVLGAVVTLIELADPAHLLLGPDLLGIGRADFASAWRMRLNCWIRVAARLSAVAWLRCRSASASATLVLYSRSSSRAMSWPAFTAWLSVTSTSLM